MREHMGLYRGKEIGENRWIQGNLLTFLDGRVTIHYYVEGWRVSIEVDPNTIGECTGLKDKNGKLIFEGDIFRSADSWIVATGSVYYDEGGWCVNNDFLQAFMWNGEVKGEIIGNIHDNPELLKGGEL